MEMFYSPLNQFLMFICAWVVIYLWKWRDPRYITVMGFYSFSTWLLIGSVLGVSRDVPWMYYPNFVGVLLLHGYDDENSLYVSTRSNEPHVE